MVSKFSKISKISHQRPDGNKLLITTDHRRDPDLARTAPLTPIADGAPDADRHRAVPSDGRKIAASAPPAAPTSPVPIQPATTAKTASAPPPDAHAAPPHRRRPLPRPPGTGLPGHRAVADPKAPRSGGHATHHSLPHSAVATATAHPARCPSPPTPPHRDAPRPVRATVNSTLTRRSDGARKHDPRPAVPSVQALPPADATVVPYHTNATVVPYHTNADLTRARPKTGDVIRIHGRSTSATVISSHPPLYPYVVMLSGLMGTGWKGGRLARENE